MDLNEHTTPNGGWQYYQPETKWGVPRRAGVPVDRNDPTVLSPVSITLNQLILAIIAMRKRNPAITAKFKLSTNYEAVKSEALRFNRKRLGLPEEGTPLPFQASRSYPKNAGAGVAAADGGIASLKRAAQGAAVVLDWLGSGAQPVEQELAERRAVICVACPKNVPGAWWTEGPAKLIKEAVEAWKKVTGKTDFEFKTEQGDKLKSCDVCKCLMQLKVHVDLQHILSKTPAEIMAEFPEACWVKRRDAA